MNKTVESFRKALTKANFGAFTLHETRLNKTNLLMTEEQKDEYIKSLEAKLHSARGFWMKQQAEIKEHLSTINKLKQDLQNTAKAPLMQIELPEQHATGDIVEQIRLAYPKKVDKDRTITSIKKAIREAKRDGMTPEAMLKTVKEYASEIKRFGINNRHEKWNLIPAPTTFFNQKRFELDPADWTANFRDGKYVDREKAPEVEVEPIHWKAVMKHLYPESVPQRHLWYHFCINHPDTSQEIKDKYTEVVKELGL